MNNPDLNQSPFRIIQAENFIARYRVWVELSIAGLIFAFWHSFVLKPLKILVVFFHEFSHALAVWLTGGSVLEFDVVAQQGGHVISQGGVGFLIVSAGYLGSLLCGVGLYALARKTRLDRYGLATVGALLIGIGVYYGFGNFLMIYGLVLGAVFIAIAVKLSNIISDLLLCIIGMTSMGYVPLDILSDTILRSGVKSDADTLGELYFGGALFWGGLWLMISFLVIGWVLWWSWRSDDLSSVRVK